MLISENQKLNRKDSLDNLDNSASQEINNESTQSKVLLVDDSVFNLIAVRGLFKQFGLDCDTAIDGSQALKLVRKQAESD